MSSRQTTGSKHSNLTRFAWLSIGAAILTIGLKAVAYGLTGSVGLLSDALESLVNLAGAVMALAMLTIAARPADDEHAYGHSKAEYFSSGVEGGLILCAAVSIAIAAMQRFLAPRPLELVGWGVAISGLASVINGLVSRVLIKAGRRYQSITLEADARHLMTDVWTSAGVLTAVGAVAWTGWSWLDPVIALVVAGFIVHSGIGIIGQSVQGLMDRAIPADELEQVHSVLASYEQRGIHFHALKTRQAGTQRFLEMHVLVSPQWSVRQGHDLLENIETDLQRVLVNAAVTTHLEPWEQAPPEREADERLSKADRDKRPNREH